MGERNVLSVENIERIARKVMPKDCDFEIKQSQTTTSVYVIIKYNGLSSTLRISDHKQHERTVKTVLVQKHTKDGLIERSIINAAKNLKQLSLDLTIGLCERKVKDNNNY